MRPIRCADCGAQNPAVIEQVDLDTLTDEILDGDGPSRAKKKDGPCG